jgi:hypothetical protein
MALLKRTNSIAGRKARGSAESQESCADAQRGKKPAAL